MKKYFAILAAAAMIVSLSGCAANAPTEIGGASNGASGGASAGDYKGTDIGGTGGSKNGILDAISDRVSGIFGAADMAAEGFSGGGLSGTAAVDGSYAAPSASTGSADSVWDDSFVGDWETGDWKPDWEPSVQPQSGLLTGGEWNDNAHWADWQELYNSHSEWNSYKSAWKNGADYRIAVKVTSDGKPLEGAAVSCEGCINTAVSDNKGMAYLFYKESNLQRISITATCGDIGADTEVDIDEPYGDLYFELDLDGAKSPINKKLDLMIMCDTTGSMGDELEYLKVELEDIVTKIQKENSNLPTRVSVNFYRDDTDEYVVRQFPFTTDIDNAVKSIRNQEASGGGDFPEAVHAALDSAVNNHDWDGDSVKIMFLVLDAPPHEDARIIDSVNRHVAKASEMGIRIVPIASSGIDKSTEYLLRTMAFTTGGTYTFLTNDSGIGGDHIEATVGAYNVEKLNDMMVRIVKSYLE